MSYRAGARSRSRFGLPSLLVGGALLLGACSSPATSSTPPTSAPTRTSAQQTQSEQPGWSPVSEYRGRILVDRRAFAFSDGHVVVVYRFRAGRVRFSLHAGSEDPPGVAARVGAAFGPSIAGGEMHTLLGAFNGGFKQVAGAGGFELNRRVYVPLSPGLASLVIDADGSAHLGVWGRSLPLAGERVQSVRQNLSALVLNAKPVPAARSVSPWGSTYAGESAVARSGVGEDRAGSILYAASMGALPIDIATALAQSGARTGMELDINPEWVQLAFTTHPGGALAAGVPGQHRPANQYVIGWTRDFLVASIAASMLRR